MSKDYIHKQERKYLHGLLDDDEISLTIKKKWGRHNFDVGDDRARRVQKRDKIHKRQMNKDLDDYDKNGKN